MLDPGIRQQLTQLFANLDGAFELRLEGGDHPRRAELRDLLAEVAGAGPRIALGDADGTSGIRFELFRDGVPTGIAFRGVPGGHEFSSLVLAVLNADGKGRLPDAGVQGRVRALNGPIRLRTYVSLSCTNCPDVVQALNLMAALHPDIAHEMIDGGLAEDEVRALGIQGVPSVFAGDTLLHVGKATLGELLEKLEDHFGHTPAQADAAPRDFDVLVLGGGPAGASAAIYSARKGLRTALVAQNLGGQVRETLGIENLISVPRTEGPRLAADLARHLASYPVEILEHRKAERVLDGPLKELHLQGGEVLRAPALIVATGAQWRELGVPGEREYLGRGVAFCPHCDGPFYKDRRVAVVGGGNSGVEAAIDLAGICSHVTLLEFAPELKADQVLVEHLLRLPNVEVLTNARSQEVLGDGTGVIGLRYEDRATGGLRTVDLDGVFVQIGLAPNSAVVRELVETTRAGEILIDAHCRTSVPGIYAAGDVSSVPFKQIVIAMGEGAKAALTAFEDRLRTA
ncbi:alkyl hydroperoxide reductase subunit F [Mesoterricola silvestris]|uniref:Alkyl hydroperoxide reductase subunit F n=1 Tax=Mesoterricola silvestris TaxID=2927979 RepID=A0AA48HA34_9BACT|nr:alkyl hydroperoxide reductase subunit F [Mesoterricola silvestris]BDU74523.1 alkyl hydroperoxide reductase subunit F [Mesoterricola silvestris]